MFHDGPETARRLFNAWKERYFLLLLVGPFGLLVSSQFFTPHLNAYAVAVVGLLLVAYFLAHVWIGLRVTFGWGPASWIGVAGAVGAVGVALWSAF